MAEINLNIDLYPEDMNKYPAFVFDHGDVHITINPAGGLHNVASQIKDLEAELTLARMPKVAPIAPPAMVAFTPDKSREVAGEIALEILQKGNYTSLFNYPAIQTLRFRINNGSYDPTAHKIQTIKIVRLLTECGLKEAKDFCDQHLFPMRKGETFGSPTPRTDNTW